MAKHRRGVMHIVGFIPARMGSSRFPGKPLAKICGLSMLEHVYRRSIMSRTLDDVYIATCDVEIKRAVASFNGKVMMTQATHERASDRVAEAMLKVEAQQNRRIDIAVMIQGDEPMVYPQMIDAAVKPLLMNSKILVSNIMAPIETSEEFKDPNSIKVVIDKDNFALYFSREPIPSPHRKTKNTPAYKQVCIIPFRRDFLLRFGLLRQTPLEIAESIDMLRVLESGGKIKMVLTNRKTYSVDTPADLKKVERHMKNDALLKYYRRRS